jgi:tetratricopeptide (TPR) repeat protein
VQLDSHRLSQYRFRHILFQKHLYNSLDPVQRVHLHEAVGKTLETLYGSGKEAIAISNGAVQLARHFQEAGNPGRAIDYLVLAGERAQRLYANAEAVAYYRRAMDLLGDPGSPESWSSQRLRMAARLLEGLGEVLEWTGEHEAATKAFQRALTSVPQDDVLWQARLQRKTGNIRRLQRHYERALQAYEEAEKLLARESAASSPEGRQEWVQIQLERMWLHYWLGQWREMSELAGQVRMNVEQHGTRAQCVSFFLCLASMYNRRDRYVVSEEALACCQTALAISQEGEDLGEIAWARFMLGFSQLWAGDLDGAVKQMQTALVLAERTGDIVHQSRCLNYLTIAHRMRGQRDQARHLATRTLEVANRAQMAEYVGTARAHLAWLAWCEGDLAKAEALGETALELWGQLPAAHSSCAFEWTALLPLVGMALASDRTAEAIEWARCLLDGTQQRLPAALAKAVDNGIRAWEEGAPERARTCLQKAVQSAQDMGHL